MRIPGIILTVLLISGCSWIADKAVDVLKGTDDGISLDAQVGSNENKVKTGVGSIGDKNTSETTIKNSENVAVDSSSGKYHLKSDKEVTVNVYETNRWLYAIFAAWLFGKPLARWYANRKTKTRRAG